MRRFPPSLILLILAVTLACPQAGAAADATDSQDVEAELADLKARIEEIRAGINALTGERDAVQARLQEIEQAIGDTVAGIRELDGSIGEQQAALDGLQIEHRAVAAELAGARVALAAQVRAAYRLGRQDALQLLIQQDDPAAVGRVLGYYRYFNKARVEQIRAVMERLARLERLETAIRDRTAELEALRDDRQAEHQRLEASRALRGSILRDLESQLSGEEGRLAGLEQDQRRLEQLLSALQQALTDAEGRMELADFDSLAGQLDMPADGDLLRRYGEKRGDARSQGWLIGARRGDPIRAVAGGQVVFADWLRGFGLLLIVDHGQDWMSLYAHADSLFRDTGEWVRAGDVLGSVGASGGRGSAALYFELRRAGEPVDPSGWVRLAAR